MFVFRARLRVMTVTLFHKGILDKQSSKTGIVLVSLPGVREFENDTTTSSVDPLSSMLLIETRRQPILSAQFTERRQSFY